MVVLLIGISSSWGVAAAAFGGRPPLSPLGAAGAI
jgi:hypothetical protein